MYFAKWTIAVLAVAFCVAFWAGAALSLFALLIAYGLTAVWVISFFRWRLRVTEQALTPNRRKLRQLVDSLCEQGAYLLSGPNNVILSVSIGRTWGKKTWTVTRKSEPPPLLMAVEIFFDSPFSKSVSSRVTQVTLLAMPIADVRKVAVFPVHTVYHVQSVYDKILEQLVRELEAATPQYW